MIYSDHLSIKLIIRVEFLGEEQKSKSKTDIVGPICESGDWLAKDVYIPSTKSGDLIVVHSCWSLWVYYE